jgi:hypothetical protein
MTRFLEYFSPGNKRAMESLTVTVGVSILREPEVPSRGNKNLISWCV